MTKSLKSVSVVFSLYQSSVSNKGNPAARHYTGMSAVAERGRLHEL